MIEIKELEADCGPLPALLIWLPLQKKIGGEIPRQFGILMDSRRLTQT